MEYVKLIKPVVKSRYVTDKGSFNEIINSRIIKIENDSNNITITNCNNIYISEGCSNIRISNCSGVTILNDSTNIVLDNVQDTIIDSVTNVSLSNTSYKQIQESNVSYENNIKVSGNISMREDILDDNGINTVQTPFTNARIEDPGLNYIYQPFYLDSAILEDGNEITIVNINKDR